jgi:peptidyl-prolyl cis-trans isomerase C
MHVIALRRLAFLAATFLGAAFTAIPFAIADDKVVAKVNGKPLTESDVRFAEAEIGQDLGNLPESTRRRVLIEYLIENQLFAEAAEGAKLGSGAEFDGRMQYWRRRALRDTYFDTSVKGAIGEVEAKKFYDEHVKQLKPEEEVKARHILVESEEKAKEIFEKLAHGADFVQMAKEFSKDPGTKDDGGSLGYFARGQMVPQFEEAAFKLGKGDTSQPVQTQFGWHLVQLEDRRERQAPEFAAVKGRLVASMIHRKAQQVATTLRESAQVEYLDAEIKKQVESETQAGAPTPKQ